MADIGARLLASFLTVFVCRIHFGTLGYHPAVDKNHAPRHNHHEAQCDQHEKHRLSLARGSATSTAPLRPQQIRPETLSESSAQVAHPANRRRGRRPASVSESQ